MKLAMLPRASELEFESRPNNILYRLHSILSTFRGGGNKTLVDMLYKKMAEADSRSAPSLAALQPSHAGYRKSRPSTRLGTDQPSQDVASVANGPSPDQDLAVTGQLPEQRTRTVGDSLNPQEELYIEPMEMDHRDDHRQAIEDPSVDGIPEMPFSPLFPTYIDQDPSYIAPTPSLHAAAATDLPALAPSWPSYDSVELMLDDFLAQVPGDPFLEDGLSEGPFMGSDLPEQVLTGRDFVGISPV